MEMTFDEWFKKFKPIKDKCGGYRLPNTASTLDYLNSLEFSTPENYYHIWTECEGENASRYLIAGYHIVNSIWYYITEVPFDEFITIELEPEEEIGV
jgi:hypothetical protein